MNAYCDTAGARLAAKLPHECDKDAPDPQKGRGKGLRKG